MDEIIQLKGNELKRHSKGVITSSILAVLKAHSVKSDERMI